MKVYGVYTGIKHEGGGIDTNLFKSYAKAKQSAKHEMKNIEDDGWELSKFKKVDGRDSWSNGIDVVAIKTFKVKD